jgi:hypothetical protein
LTSALTSAKVALRLAQHVADGAPPRAAAFSGPMTMSATAPISAILSKPKVDHV